jgi:hypothetical protein
VVDLQHLQSVLLQHLGVQPWHGPFGCACGAR